MLKLNYFYKKNLFTIIVILLATACSKEDKPTVSLDGNYISDKAGIEEIFLLSLQGESGTWSSYNTGKQVKQESITWSATGNSITINNGTPTTYSLQTKDGGIIIGDVTYRKAPGNRFQEIVGHTYIGADKFSGRTIYLSYTFSKNNVVVLSKHYTYIGGPLYEELRGTYDMNGSSISMKIPFNSILGCDYFSYYTVTLSSDKQSFIYSSFDPLIKDMKTLFFYATK